MRPLRFGLRPRPPLLSYDHGPGRRWVLFLQGCRVHCTDRCLNPQYLDPAGGESVSAWEAEFIAEQVAAGTWGAVEGLTVLGGEPSDQAEELIPLLDATRAWGLGVMLYSGRTRAWLEAQAPDLLRRCDLLVDGAFVPALHDPELRWRGSSNQVIHHLSARYDPAELAAHQTRRGLTLALPAQGRPVLAGMQLPAVAAVVAAAVGAAAPRYSTPTGAGALEDSPSRRPKG